MPNLLRVRKVRTEMSLLDASTGAKPVRVGDEYLGRLTKLIPGEATAAYVSGHAVAAANGFLAWWALTCLGLAVLLRAATTLDQDAAKPLLQRVQWTSVVLVSTSFALWVHALGDHLPGLTGVPVAAASLAVIIWTAAVPALYKGD